MNGKVSATESPTTIPTMSVPSACVGANGLVIAVVPGNLTYTGAASLGQPKLIRAIMTPGSKTPAQSVKGCVILPSGASVQPNTTVGQSRITSMLNTNGGSRLVTLSEPPDSKQPVQPYSAEDMSKILSGLTRLATRFLPALRNANQVVSQLPDFAECVRKYLQMRDNMKHPQSNLN
ncbi:hypothetical protein D915_008615 [Fasciola hepatica]|uniref:Uncharacterized protein n=1 Tax=Fasciola hepatica TaxID=6192 RepID=A0A4E0QZ09_FASHE|nr:hypothetical protein D915_008615 [Fasciola hepatica]